MICVTALTADEARRLVHAAKDDRMQARWIVGLALGLRQGEALGLRWEDVDLDARLLRIRRALQRQRGGGLVFTEPKTRRSKRTVPLPVPLVQALIEHRERQDKERVTAGSMWQGSPCVFTSPIGTPVDPRNDFREFRKLLARAGVPWAQTPRHDKIFRAVSDLVTVPGQDVHNDVHDLAAGPSAVRVLDILAPLVQLVQRARLPGGMDGSFVIAALSGL